MPVAKEARTRRTGAAEDGKEPQQQQEQRTLRGRARSTVSKCAPFSVLPVELVQGEQKMWVFELLGAFRRPGIMSHVPATRRMAWQAWLNER